MTPFQSELTLARAAQQAWARVRVRDRLRSVRTLRALLVERADDLCAAIGADIARPPVEVIGSELLPSAAALKFLEARAERVLAPQRVSWWDQPTWLFGCRDAIHHRPWGVVGVIGTWNYPLYLNVVPLAQALVAGNAVLWKPSENVPRTAELTHELVRAAGFPAELVQVLPAAREAGPRLIETDVDHVVFTGSDAVGRKLAARLGERLIPSTLELSGCDAMFVLADANLAMAARAAWFGLTLNRGQTCVAVRRIFVQRDRLEAFAAALSPLARAEPLGLVLDSQRAQAERLIADAVARGAHVLTRAEGSPATLAAEVGGASSVAPFGVKVGPTSPTRGAEEQAAKADTPALTVAGSSLRPTFLLNVPPEAAFCRESCFAPLAAIVPFDTVDDAVSLARRSPFGLSASVFSADTAAAKELAARIPSGSVVINDVVAPTAHPATPFGGRGASGWGVTQGADGLLALTVPQVVTVHAGTFRPHLDATANDDPATAEILRGLLTWTHARGPGTKVRGLWRLVRGIRNKK